MSEQAQLINDAGSVKFVASVALLSGEIIQLADGRPAVVGGLNVVAVGDMANAYTQGRFAAASASATVFALGAPVYWDTANDLAIVSPVAANDLYLGTATKAKASGDVTVELDLNNGLAGAGSSGQRGIWTTRVVELDHADVAEFDLSTALEAPNGLAIHSFTSEVTEQPAGTEDQLEVTLFDGDDVAQSVMITSATPDAIGDLIVGNRTLTGGATGQVLGKIAPNKRSYAKVTQPTTGSAAGKLKVRAVYGPLV